MKKQLRDNPMRKTIRILVCLAVLGLPGLFDRADSATVALPRTGQTVPYYPGDDGSIKAGAAWPIPRFSITFCDNAGPCADPAQDCDGNDTNDVVTDQMTGLMWLRNGSQGLMSIWPPYLNYSNNLSRCGYADWRLANVRELESLMNAGQINPDIWLNSQGFVGVQPVGYWTSTSLNQIPNYAWLVLFHFEIALAGENLDSDYAKNISLYGWPVRTAAGVLTSPVVPRTGQNTCFDGIGKTLPCAGTGQDGDLQAGAPWPDPRFTDLGNGTVADNLTGLIWLKDANCLATHYGGVDIEGTPGDGRVTWSKALDFIAGINSGTYPNCGSVYRDWRLPNRKELHSLIDFSRYLVALPAGHPFINVQTGYYWSSSTKADETLKAWVVGLWDGRIAGFPKGNPSSLPLWPVRGGLGPGL